MEIERVYENGIMVFKPIDHTKCENNCFDGKVKHYPDPSKALFDMVKCPECNGTGFQKYEH